MYAKRIIYVIQSETTPSRHYAGLTANVLNRLADHNAGEGRHTRKYHPWRVVVSMEFARQERAIAFEKYLKSGSGHAFATRHFCGL